MLSISIIFSSLFSIIFSLLRRKVCSDDKVDECSSCSLEELVCMNRTEKVCRADISCEQNTAVSSCSLEEFTEHRLQCTTEMQAGVADPDRYFFRILFLDPVLLKGGLRIRFY